MSVRRVEVACAACGAAVAGAPGSRLDCDRCGIPLALIDERRAPESGLPPRLDAACAHDAFARLFVNDGEPEPGPPPTSARLFYAPFYELAGTMVGEAADGRPVHRWAVAHIAAMEDRDELGLAAIDAARLNEVASHELVPIDELGRRGEVLFPDRERDQVEAFLADEVRMPADGAAPVLVDRRFALLYYPVWRLRYRVGGELYQATIDGLTGTVLHARVAARQRRRAFLGVFASACGGYVLGTMLRHPAMGIPGLMNAIGRADPLALLPTLALALIGALLYVLLLNAAWNALRYRNELVYTAGLKTRVLIDRPAETLLDRVTAGVKAGWGRLVAPRRFDR